MRRLLPQQSTLAPLTAHRSGENGTITFDVAATARYYTQDSMHGSVVVLFAASSLGSVEFDGAEMSIHEELASVFTRAGLPVEAIPARSRRDAGSNPHTHRIRRGIAQSIIG